MAHIARIWLVNLWTSLPLIGWMSLSCLKRQGQPPRLWPADTWSVATFHCQRNIVMWGQHKCDQIDWHQVGEVWLIVLKSLAFKMTQDTKDLSDMEGGMVALLAMAVILVFLLIFFCLMPYIREQLRYLFYFIRTQIAIFPIWQFLHHTHRKWFNFQIVKPWP